ncbi:Protein jagged-2 [Desmophyllum pertusum]|uniref:Delta-like protein n=1 Tax=Desmophyllum pertusum TaxID=174260 RepID=A0A9X0CG40_9CNID|nr:Protein jagged-2 [Desmophyllum pertusum]
MSDMFYKVQQVSWTEDGSRQVDDHLVSCEGSGRVIVTLRSYSNPSHRKSNFKCCDIGFLSCSGCDAYFKLCVTQSVSSSAHSCNIGTSKTPVVGNKDDHRFNIRKEFAFTSFRRQPLNLQLEVWDWDKISDDDKVETLKRSVTPWTSSPVHYRERLTLQSNPRRVTVTLDMEVYCDKNYYGPSCSAKCVPRDDSSGHYTCDDQGRKVCRRHWYGNANFPMARKSAYRGGLVPSVRRTAFLTTTLTAGITTVAHDGSKVCLYGWHGENCTVFCVAQDDDQRGHYTCDNEGNKVCMDGYRPPDCTDCLLGRYGANCSLTCLTNDTSPSQQGYYYCTENGVKHCSPWWYGPECLEHCVPHDDSVHGHYTCDERDGRKVCRDGWEGPSCLDRKQN